MVLFSKPKPLPSKSSPSPSITTTGGTAGSFILPTLSSGTGITNINSGIAISNGLSGLHWYDVEKSYSDRLADVLHHLPHSVIKWALKKQSYSNGYPSFGLISDPEGDSITAMLKKILTVNETNVKSIVKEMIMRGYI